VLAIQDLQDQACRAIGSEQERVTLEQLGALVTQTNKECAKAKRIVETMKKDTDALERQAAHVAADVRIRRNLQASTLHSLVSAMQAYQGAQHRFKQAVKTKAARQIKVVKPTATDDEVDMVLRTGDVSAMYREAILQPHADPVATAYVNMSDKLRDVLVLEQSVEELHRMFIDMALLVENQGVALNSIEESVAQTREHMRRGVEDLNAGAKVRKAARRKMMCCMLVLALVLLIILGPVLGVLA